MHTFRVRWPVLTGLMFFALTPATLFAAPQIIEESARLVSPDPEFPLNGPVAMAENTIVVGSRADLGDEMFNLAVYVIEREAGTSTWASATKLAEFTGRNPWTNQLSVAVSGSTVAIGTYDAAYVYERSSSGWHLAATLTRPPSTWGFGSDVSVSLNRVLVGGISYSGWAAFVYERSESGQWLPTATLVAGLAKGMELIGPAVELHRDRAAIGNYNNAAEDAEPGRIYFYRAQNDGNWLSIDNMSGWEPTAFSASEIAMAPPYAVMSEGGFDGVSIFEETQPDSWSPVGHFQAIDGPMFPGGPALDIDYRRAPVIAVGAAGDEDRGRDSGSITIYERRVNNGSSDFVARVKLLASDSKPGLRLGGSVSIHRGSVAATSREALYLFDLPVTHESSFYEPGPLQDTFEDGNANGWLVRSSTWKIVNAAGTRAYRQTKTSGDALTLLQDARWIDARNQAIQVDVRPLAFNGTDRWVGLVARYADDHNNYYVTLRSSNRVELGRRVNNKFTTLGIAPVTVAANRPYRLRLEAIGTWLRVYVDGVLKIESRDSVLTHGTVGLRTAHASANYDNIVVSRTAALHLLVDDFENESRNAWLKTPGENWMTVGSSAGGRVLRQSVAMGPARAISGVAWHTQNTSDADQIVEARARALSFISGQDPWFGLIARYKTDNDYVYITVNRNGYISLRKLVNGAIQVFDTAPFTLKIGTWYRFRLEAIGENLRAYVNGRLVLEGRDPDAFSGQNNRFGLMTSRAAAEFDDVRVTQP